MFDFEERVLIGWLANTAREPANQDAYLKVQHFCFYVKVVHHFRPDYSICYIVYSVQYTCYNENTSVCYMILLIVYNYKNYYLF